MTLIPHRFRLEFLQPGGEHSADSPEEIEVQFHWAPQCVRIVSPGWCVKTAGEMDSFLSVVELHISQMVKELSDE